MDISKTIKKQALSYLAKDNWETAVGGFFVILLPAVVIMLVFSTFGAVADAFMSKKFSELYSTYLQYLALPLLLLTTPVLTGYLKMCYDISKGKNVQLKDIFYYIKRGKYAKTVYINTVITAGITAAFIVAMIPASVFVYLYNSSDNIIFYIFALLLGICGILASLFWGIGYIFVPTVYFEYEMLSYSEIAAKAKMFKIEKIKDVYKLLFSFLPWILLCFLVVPWIFVFPYICVSFMNNGKWINELYKNSQKEVSPFDI